MEQPDAGIATVMVGGGDRVTTRDQESDEVWAAVDRIRDRNAGRDPENERSFVTGIVEEVRRERHERRRSEAQDGR